MRRWLVVAAVGGRLLAGCSSSGAVRQTTPSATSSTQITGFRAVSGAVTFTDEWAFDPGDFPRSVNNGEECWLVGDLGGSGQDLGPQLVVESGTGEVIGEDELGSGEISGLGSAGFDLPSQLETVLIASESLMRRATCSFAFSIDVPGESPSYRFIVNGRPGVVYSQDALDALDSMVEFEEG